MSRLPDPEELEAFQEHGWVLLRSLLDPEEIEAAYEGLYAVYPTAEAFHSGEREFRKPAFLSIADSEENQGDEPRFRAMQFAGLREFPFHSLELNLLALHPSIIEVAELLLGSGDVRLYQAETFAKYTGVTQYEQPFHVDYTNHTMLPPGRHGRYRQVQMFLYLTDVTLQHGPTRILSRRLTDEFPLAKLTEMGADIESEQVTRWESAAQNAVGPRGSLLVYSADVMHRGTAMTLERGSRFTFNISYKVANADWVGANPWPRKGFYEPWEPLVNACSVRQLEVLGFPPPGHDYWDETSLKGCAERYPQLDLSPWRNALTSK